MRRIIGILCLCTLLVLNAGCKKKDDAPQAPEAYAIGEDSAPPLDAQLSDKGKLVSVELPSEADEDDKDDEADGGDGVGNAPEDGKEPGEQYVYTYGGLESGGATAQAYAESLTGEEGGFTVIDQNGKVAAPPDYTADSGMVLLAEDSSEQDARFQIGVSWSETGCVVIVEKVPGAVAEETEEMSNKQAVEYLKSLSPTSLGLEGESMGVYSVYAMDGSVMADGNACLKLQVYSRTPQNTNRIEGIYLLSGDKAHLYRVEDDGLTVREIAT